MTTWVNSQFPRPDFHRQVQRHYGLQTQILTLSDPKIRGQEPKTLSKRAHNPLLKEAGLTKPTAAVPWLGGRLVRLACPWRPQGESGHRTRMHASRHREVGCHRGKLRLRDHRRSSHLRPMPAAGNWLCFSGLIPPWLVLSHNMPTINATDTTSKLGMVQKRPFSGNTWALSAHPDRSRVGAGLRESLAAVLGLQFRENRVYPRSSSQ